MVRFTRFFAATLAAAALTMSTASLAQEPVRPAGAAAVAPHSVPATLDLERAVARRSKRNCVRWWTCGPFKKDKPRMA